MTGPPYDQPLMIKLEPALKRRLKTAAARQGTDMSKIVRALIVEHLDEIDPETGRADIGAWIERVRGSATSGLTTDEIMSLTRGE